VGWRSAGSVAWILVLAATATSAPPAKPAKGPDAAAALAVLGGGDSTAALAGNLRAFLVKSLPEPLFEDRRHWDQKKPGPRGKMRNDGRWWKVTAQALDPARTLVLDLKDLEKPAPGRTVFVGYLALDVRVNVERQLWRAGLRLYSTSTRARLRVKLTVKCEATTRIQPTGTLVPDAVFRLRVLESDVRYDNLVVEHTAGVGGEAAKLIGDLVVGGAHRFKPSVERNLLARANAAVVKAGDTKEVRLSLLGLLNGKK
jgi:hypothetical protein